MPQHRPPQLPAELVQYVAEYVEAKEALEAHCARLGIRLETSLYDQEGTRGQDHHCVVVVAPADLTAQQACGMIAKGLRHLPFGEHDIPSRFADLVECAGERPRAPDEILGEQLCLPGRTNALRRARLWLRQAEQDSLRLWAQARGLAYDPELGPEKLREPA